MNATNTITKLNSLKEAAKAWDAISASRSGFEVTCPFSGVKLTCRNKKADGFFSWVLTIDGREEFFGLLQSARNAAVNLIEQGRVDTEADTEAGKNPYWLTLAEEFPMPAPAPVPALEPTKVLRDQQIFIIWGQVGGCSTTVKNLSFWGALRTLENKFDQGEGRQGFDLDWTMLRRKHNAMLNRARQWTASGDVEKGRDLVKALRAEIRIIMGTVNNFKN